jgi:peptide/nickel transport system ATP-binding protein
MTAPADRPPPAALPARQDIVLEAVALTKRYRVAPAGPRASRVLLAVDSVSLRVHRGETLGLVGESGCGKSTLGRCLLRLQTLSEGAVRFQGQDISTLSLRALRPLRPRMQMVFQDPYGSLNPRRQVGDLIAEPLRVHRLPDGTRRRPADIAARVADLVELVGLRRDQLARYPHEFSGGQRQRIGIARALALDPALIVADEPVSALDVSVQAQVVNLLMDLQERLGLTYVFIAHDLAVIRQIATRTAVMYLGAIVELAPTADLFAAPAHPYSAALLDAVPRLDSAGQAPAPLRGEVPSPMTPPPGCRFHPRCPRAQPRCATERPTLQPLAPTRAVACFYPL